MWHQSQAGISRIAKNVLSCAMLNPNNAQIKNNNTGHARTILDVSFSVNYT